jgi:hypothetical protein
VSVKRKYSTAFTLYETLVTLALFSMLMTMIVSVFINMSRIHRAGIEMARLRERASNALDVMCTDLSRAYRFDYAAATDVRFKMTDPHRSDTSPASGGELTVRYYFRPPSLIRTDRYSTTIIADQVSRLNFSSFNTNPPFWINRVDIEVATNTDDLTSRRYSLSLDISPRCYGGQQDFGP